jgi:hypothetical protein
MLLQGIREAGGPVLGYASVRPTACCWLVISTLQDRLLCLSAAASTEHARKPLRARIYFTLALDERIQRLGMRFGFQCVPQNAGPFGPRAFVDLGRVRSASNHCGERLVVIGWDDVV